MTNTFNSIQNTLVTEDITDTNNLLSTIPIKERISTPIPEFSDRVLVCQQGQNDSGEIIDSFYWIEINDKNLQFSDVNTHEPYFQYDKKYLGEKWILDFSSDYRSFLYSKFQNENEVDLYQYEIDSSKSSIISNEGTILYAQYSYNDKHILFRNNSNELYISDINGKVQRVGPNYLISDASFSPINDEIIFLGTTESKYWNEINSGNTDFCLYLTGSTDFTAVEQISTDIDELGNCGLSSESGPIIWLSDPLSIIYKKELSNGKETICQNNISTHEENCLIGVQFYSIKNYKITSQQNIVFQALSEKPSSIKCEDGCYDKDLNWEIYILNLGTYQIKNLSNSFQADIDPILINNGNYVVYNRYINNKWQLFITDLVGSFQKQLTFSEESNYLNGMCPDY